MTATVSVYSPIAPPLLGHTDYGNKPVAVIGVRARFDYDRQPSLDFDAVLIKKDGTPGTGVRNLRYGSVVWVDLPAGVRHALIADAAADVEVLRASLAALGGAA